MNYPIENEVLNSSNATEGGTEPETKVTLVEESKKIIDPKALDDKEPDMFKDRQAEMGWCKHDAPREENGLMRCPFCGEVAIGTEHNGNVVYSYED